MMMNDTNKTTRGNETVHYGTDINETYCGRAFEPGEDVQVTYNKKKVTCFRCLGEMALAAEDH